MFRRKEEGLFDNANDENAMQGDEMQTETGSSSAQAAPAASFQPATSFASANASAPAAAPQAANAPIARPAAAPTASSFRPATAAAPAAPLASDMVRRMPEAKPAAAPVAAPVAAQPAAEGKMAKRVLTVGNDILLKGEIATCDRLVIDGRVDATLNDVHTVEISECGSFKGSAQIENAEISGLFEGDLTVRGRLVIYATGKVRGKISYGEIEIERGGELTGEIKMASSATAARPATAKGEKMAA